jgi:hypothetical protein
MSSNSARRSSDPYEHEGIIHRVQQKNSHAGVSSPYAQAENNGFHPAEQRGSVSVKQEEESRAGPHYGEPEEHLDASEKNPAEPISREVDEDYDETAADTLMSIAQTGGRKRSLDRKDEVANIDSDSKRPKPAESAMEEDHLPPATEEPQQQEPVSEVVPQETPTVETEKPSSPVVAEQQPREPSPPAEQEESKDEPMEESTPEPAAAPAEDKPTAAAEEAEEKPLSRVHEAAEGEADPEKEEGETDAVDLSKEDQEAGEASEPEAGEVTPSPEATTA